MVFGRVDGAVSVRRVAEAESWRGCVAASTTRRMKTYGTPRPPIGLSPNPGRRQSSQDSHRLALGYVVKPFQGRTLRRMSYSEVALPN